MKTELKGVTVIAVLDYNSEAIQEFNCNCSVKGGCWVDVLGRRGKTGGNRYNYTRPGNQFRNNSSL